MKLHGRSWVAVAAVAGMLAHALWTTAQSAAFGPHAWGDGVREYGALDEPRLRHVVWDPQPDTTPPGSLSRSRSLDGHWQVFSAPVEGRGLDLFLEALDSEGHSLGSALPLNELNSEADESSPSFDAAGLWFASGRAGGFGGSDLWHAALGANGLEVAELLPQPINSAADETQPVPLVEGQRTLAVVFVRAQTPQPGDLLLAHPQALPARDGTSAQSWSLDALERVNSPASECDPAWSGAGTSLWFSSSRTGNFELWRAQLQAGEWLAARELAGLSTAADERRPRPSEDGFGLSFERELVGDTGLLSVDSWRARSLELCALPDRAWSLWDLGVQLALALLALLALLSQRWPGLDLIYKCYLASLLLHLLLLALLRYVLLDHAGLPRRQSEPAIQIRLEDPQAEPSRPLEVEVRAEASKRLEQSLALQRELETAGPERSAAELEQAALPERQSMEAPLLSSNEPRLPQEQELEQELPDAERARVASGALEDRVTLAERTPQAWAPAELLNRPQASPSSRPSSRAPAADLPRFSPSTRRDERSAAEPPAMSLEVPEREQGPQVPALASSTPTSLERAAPASGSGALVQLEDEVELAPASDQTGPRSAPTDFFGAAPATSAQALPQRAALEALRAPAAPGPSPAPAAAPRPLALDAGNAPALLPELPRALESSLTRADQAVRDPGLGASSLRDQPVLEARDPAAQAPPPAARDFLAQAAKPESADPNRPHTPRSVPRLEPSAPSTPAQQLTRAPAPQPLDAPPTAPPPGLERPQVPSTGALAQTPYRSRFGAEKVQALDDNGGTALTEQAVARGLAYLARIQRTDGGWGDPTRRDGKYGETRVGASALCLLAFLGAGHVQDQPGPYQASVARAIDALLARQDPRTGHFGDSEAYSHGIATYALCEALALTGDERLRPALERAVARILDEQLDMRDTRKTGGWSYYYPDGRVFDEWPRVSISAWQVMALESAQLSGIDVPHAAFEQARKFLLQSQQSPDGSFAYSLDPARLQSDWGTLPGSTPAALFALSLLGEQLDEARWQRSIDFVVSRAPLGYQCRSEDLFVQRAEGNLYFWYYGTLSLFRLGGNAWRRWNAALQDTLLPAQQPDGSFAPLDPYARYAGDTQRESVYSTALCVLSLEVYYRYFTPLLQVR